MGMIKNPIKRMISLVEFISSELGFLYFFALAESACR